jgi:hypothetical protein
MGHAIVERMSHWLAYDLLLLGSSGYALLRGGGPERAGALLMLAGVFASTILVSPIVSPTSRFSHLEWRILCVDFAAYLASTALMLRANRYWTIWMSGIMGVGLLAHLLAIPGWPSLNLTYAILEKIWGYPLALLPAIGAWRHRGRLMKHGSDKSWNDFSLQSRPRKRVGSLID